VSFIMRLSVRLLRARIPTRGLAPDCEDASIRSECVARYTRRATHLAFGAKCAKPVTHSKAWGPALRSKTWPAGNRVMVDLQALAAGFLLS